MRRTKTHQTCKYCRVFDVNLGNYTECMYRDRCTRHRKLIDFALYIEIERHHQDSLKQTYTNIGYTVLN